MNVVLKRCWQSSGLMMVTRSCRCLVGLCKDTGALQPIIYHTGTKDRISTAASRSTTTKKAYSTNFCIERNRKLLFNFLRLVPVIASALSDNRSLRYDKLSRDKRAPQAASNLSDTTYLQCSFWKLVDGGLHKTLKTSKMLGLVSYDSSEDEAEVPEVKSSSKVSV